MNLKLTPPVKNGVVSQGYAGNGNSFYRENNLMGHPGTDWISHYDDTIVDSVVGFNKKYVYKIINRDNSDLSKYRAVFQIVEADDGVFEVSYGHCNKITCSHGYTEAGSPLATEGNTGDVYVNGVAVTATEKEKGSKAGAHIHHQLRRIAKTKLTTLTTLSAENGSDFIDEEGYHFDISNYSNGYNGCIDLMPYITGSVAVPVRLYPAQYGQTSENVRNIQKRLISLGYVIPAGSTGYYGSQTVAAVFAFQTAHVELSWYERYILAGSKVGDKTIRALEMRV